MSKFLPPTLRHWLANTSAAVLSLGLMAGATAQTTPRSEPIPGQYIVVFKPSVGDAAVLGRRLAAQSGGRLLHSYGTAIKGFSVSNLPDAAVEALRRNPNVAYVEQDQTVYAVENQVDQSPDYPLSWGLDRIDESDRPLEGNYTYNNTGSGVTAYVIDTGIQISHIDFGGRAVSGWDFIDGDNVAQDCNGHGTHVAGTVGGATYGVAKEVSLVAVRVLDCRGSGSYAGVIDGIDWVAASHLANLGAKSVANMSLGGGFSAGVNEAVAGAVSAGVTMVVAAGNETADACTKSPASEPSAITVGATDSSDNRASYSNYGSCVDIFAPGSGITSAWIDSTKGKNPPPIDGNKKTISGTSMASPHVAGVVALLLESAASEDAAPAAITSALLADATPGRVANVGANSPNLLLQTPDAVAENGGDGTGGGGDTGSGGGSASELTITGASQLWTGGVWKAVATVSGPAGTYSVGFSPSGGSGSCTIGASANSCAVTSDFIANKVNPVTAAVDGGPSVVIYR